MSTEQLLIYLLVGGFTLLQFVAGALKRRREKEIEQQSAPVPAAPEPDERWWSPVSEAPPPEVRVEATPRPAVPRPGAAERSDARPSPRQPAKALRRPAYTQPAWSHHGIALKDRAELRRAFELMAILGPPRSRAADES